MAVLSISSSGHKYGQSVCGTGFVVWRQREGLAEHVAVTCGYLGGKIDSYTLNFSRPATGVYVQVSPFLRVELTPCPYLIGSDSVLILSLVCLPAAGLQVSPVGAGRVSR